MAELSHEAFIHHMPVEIISSIFLFVKEAIFDFKFKEHPDYFVPTLPFEQPSISPPLLVGAVCKGWRNISLTTPQLWTDITIDLIKSAEGQFNMVREWAHRSGALPLDIGIFLDQYYLEQDCPGSSIVLLTLRSFAPRWNDLALCVPSSICYKLLDGLEATPTINSLFLFDLYGKIEQIKLPHPLRPRRLISDFFYETEIPLDWDRLVFLKLDHSESDQVLHIIQRAEKLRHCIAGGQHNLDSSVDSSETFPIVNCSLVYLDTFGDIIQRLTLPSLLHLDYGPTDLDESLGHMLRFLERSSTTLNSFVYRRGVCLEDPFPNFERLPGITSLVLEIFTNLENRDPTQIDHFLNALTKSCPNALPRLKEITFELPDLTASSWLLLNRLFHEDSETADIPVISDTYTPTRKSISGVRIPLSKDIKAAMKTKAFSRLLQVKNSGIAINVVGSGGRDTLIL